MKKQATNTLINWKQLSITLSGSETSVRRNRIPKKYEEKVDLLNRLLDTWEEWAKQ